MLINHALIVAPLSILGVWEEEFAKFADFPYTLATLQGSGAQKDVYRKGINPYA